MKNLLIICFTTLTCYSLISCKKSNDATAPAVNAGPIWKDSLQNTVWSGEFKYTNGTNTPSLQPFSMELKSDGTVSWADELSIRDAGAWTVNETQATLTFPNKTSLTAQVARDKWTSFSNPSANGFMVNNMVSAIPVRGTSLEGNGFMGSQNGKPLIIRFITGGMVRYINDGFVDFTVPYTIVGAGVRFVFSATGFSYTIFLVPGDNYKKLRGCSHIVETGNSYYFNYTVNR